MPFAGAFCALLLILALTPGCKRTTSNSGRASTVRLNEVMARNQTFGVVDDAENIVHRDWVEIHNTSSAAVSLSGYTLSDDFNRPQKFTFPLGTLLGPRDYLIVFLFNEARCRSDCQGLDTCLSQCTPPVGLVADFNLAGGGETIFLFMNDGTTFVEQVGVQDQQPDTSNGRDPVTGTYGVIYLPTPRSENKPINLKPHTVSVSVSSPADQEATVSLEIDRDADAPGELEVTLQWGDVVDCGDVLLEEDLTPGEVTRVVPPGGDPVKTDIRLDPSSNPLPMDRVTLTYVAVLPAAACGTVRAVRITSRDELATVVTDNTCSEYCSELPTVLVNEYLPRNTLDKFHYINSLDDEVVPESPQDFPDWIEIYNYGDLEVDMTRLSLITEREREAGIYDAWLFGRDGQTATLPAGEYLLVLADGDGGSFRRSYFRPSARECIFYSTHFQLDPDKPTIDEFSLFDASLGQEIERVVLDFSAFGGNIGDNIAVGRFEGTEPDALLIPGPDTITKCPTPPKCPTLEGENKRSCGECLPTTLATLFQDTFHELFPPPPLTERNACVPGNTQLDLKAIFSVDEQLVDVLQRGFVSASFFVDLDRGQGEEEIPVTEFLPFPNPPAGYKNVRMQVTISPPIGTVLHYRVQATDACGDVFDQGPFSVGTTAGDHPQIAINEINRSHAVPGDDSGRAWVELFNRSSEEVSLSGMFLSDDTASPHKVSLPAGALIPAGGFVLLLTDGAETVPPHVKVDLDWTAENGTLFLADTLERGTCILDSVEFEGLSEGQSFGRVPDGTGPVDPLPAPSPGLSNADVITFVRGDADSDLRITVLDAIRLIAILFEGDPRRPPCESALDANGDGDINLTDPVFLLDFLLGVVPTIPPPFPEPGPCISN